MSCSFMCDYYCVYSYFCELNTTVTFEKNKECLKGLTYYGKHLPRNDEDDNSLHEVYKVLSQSVDLIIEEVEED